MLLLLTMAWASTVHAGDAQEIKYTNAGINDGHKGSVPISQSLLAFNEVAAAKDQLSSEDISFFVREAKVPPHLKADLSDPTYGNKQPLFRRQSGNATVTIFDGAHELVAPAAIAWIQEIHDRKKAQNKPEAGNTNLAVISEHQGPVIGPDHPDVKASGNRSGFETGEMIKHKGVYHMFVNEMFGQHHIDMRVSHWSSPDAINWKRQSTVVDRVPGRSHTNPRSEVWLTGVEYNEDEGAWNIFFVSYRGGNPQAGEGFRADYEGKIWRGRSTVKGPDGIAGPYKDVEIILQPDENTQKWEGQQAVDSFNPYKVGDTWYGFYGGHYHTPRGPWPVGLARADKLGGHWKRMPEGFNPVPIVKTFVENPVVSKLPDGRYLAIFDSLGPREIGTSISKDGITWPPETRLTAQTGSNKWAGDGDHDMRTPLCAVREEDGTFTVIYTAKMKDQEFWAMGKCTLGWKDAATASD
jgi:hypothetical protein